MHLHTPIFILLFTSISTAHSKPILITQIQGINNEATLEPGKLSIPWLTSTVQNITDQGAEIALERAEASPGIVEQSEAIAYLKIQANVHGTFQADDDVAITFETQLSPSIIQGWDSGCTQLDFQTDYSAPPVVFAAQSTRKGNNGGWLRRCSLTADKLGLTIDEDRYRDSERNHIGEAASLLVFSRPFAVQFEADDHWGLETGNAEIEATNVTAKFTSITFKQTYSEPPAVFILPSSEGNNPASVRIKNITTDGFEMVSVEPAGDNGRHIAMNIQYLAISYGNHTLPDGQPIKVGVVNTSAVQHGKGVVGETHWQSISFIEESLVPIPDGRADSECSIFPSDNPWNQDVSALPVHPDSDAYIASIGLDGHAHADFGTVWNGAPNGIPVVDVKPNTPRRTVEFLYADESDHELYPIPDNPPIQGGPEGTGDRHIIMLDREACKLYELFWSWAPNTGENPLADRWYAGAGAIFDLKSNQLRPDFWTSADAAGLPVFPGLVTYDEVMLDKEIRHALRFTTRKTQKAFIHPATHFASSSRDANLPPMGLRVRLKADYDISGFSEEVQVILRALKKYGMLLADNGQNWFISGSPDPRWNDNNLHQFHDVPGSAFEAVYTGELITR